MLKIFRGLGSTTKFFNTCENGHVHVHLQWCVRGYHIYKEEWENAVSEELKCEREKNNAKDPYAGAVVRENVIVGHLPRKISRINALFLKRQGKISCKVLGRRHYSATRGSGDSVCKFSLFKKFRVLNFHGLLRPRNFFNNENFRARNF